MKLLLPLLLLLYATSAAAQNRALDAAKSRVAFIYTLERKIAVEGRFPRFAAQLSFDEKAPEKGSVRIDIDVAAIDTGTSDGDAEAKQPLWFDAARFPQASFVSSAIRRVGERRYEALGSLTIKGRTREAAIPFSAANAPGGGLSVQGSLTIKRLAFGIGLEQWADVSQIADEVEIRFSLALGPPRSP